VGLDFVKMGPGPENWLAATSSASRRVKRLAQQIRQGEFVFDSQEESGRLLLYATPSPYRKPGRVSLVAELTEELLNREGVDFCFALASAFHGEDRKGARASLNDPAFIPYGFHTYEPCI
jgi:hypothetical protein